MRILTGIILLFPLFIYGQFPDNVQENVYAQVTGSTVYLSQSMVVRNCGAAYDMHTILVGDTLYWYQVDTGATAVCLCKFDLSVTVDSLPTGHYTAKVFYTSCPDCPPPGSDTGYVGSVEFDIPEPNSCTAIRQIDQYQSVCSPYNAIGEKDIRVPPYSIFPIPVQSILHFITADPGDKTIRILDLQNRSLFESGFKNMAVEIDLTSYRSGIYIFVYSNQSTTYHRKFIRK
jgi:hypothetical protein